MVRRRGQARARSRLAADLGLPVLRARARSRLASAVGHGLAWSDFVWRGNAVSSVSLAKSRQAKRRQSEAPAMDLGIGGRKALVCASSKGLGRACAEKLAEAGCEVVVNGRSRDSTEATAADIRKATGAKVTAVAADVASPEGQAALFGVCPQPDILVTNNLGPPPRPYGEVNRQQMLEGVTGSMVAPIGSSKKRSSIWWPTNSGASSTSPRAVC